MSLQPPRRLLTAGATLVGSAVCLGGLATLPTAAAAAAATPTITISSPSDGETVKAGAVRLTGSANAGSVQSTTSVVYLVDVSLSTVQNPGSDCNADGVVSAADDLNADGVAGSTLDCEIAGIMALNNSLSAASAGSNVHVAVQPFADVSVAAAMRPDGTTFVSPEETAADGSRRVDTVARSLVKNNVLQYVAKNVGEGTNFNDSVSSALATLATAPTGPKWVFMLSDGESNISTATLTKVHASGAKLRTFAVGPAATCASTGSLAQLAAASGDQCVTATAPASLAASIVNTTPSSIASVQVAVGGQTVNATIDAVGNWSAPVTLGAGGYTATAAVTATSGATAAVTRTFYVAAVAVPTTRTAVKVKTPAATRQRFPSKITGAIGFVGKVAAPRPNLDAGKAVLQGRTSSKAKWVILGTTNVRKGKFSLRWKYSPKYTQLRVVSPTRRGLAASATSVPAPPISYCVKKVTGKRWSVTCKTTAKKGTTARLVKGKTVISTTKVAKGVVTLKGTGKVGGKVVEVRTSKKHPLRLKL